MTWVIVLGTPDTAPPLAYAAPPDEGRDVAVVGPKWTTDIAAGVFGFATQVEASIFAGTFAGRHAVPTHTREVGE